MISPFYLLLKSLAWCLNILVPRVLSRLFLYAILRVVFLIKSKYQQIAIKNLSLAFPDCSKKALEELYKRSIYGLSVLIDDLLRLGATSRDWVDRHVKLVFSEGLEQRIKEREADRGVLVITGHLGSFELMAYAIPFLFEPISFVVRNLKSGWMDSSLNAIRESSGNSVIPRKGAGSTMMSLLGNGKVVALLFDQNVTRNYAVFVDWFGRLAATTRIPAVLTMRKNPIVILASMERVSTDKYVIAVDEIATQDILESRELGKQEKLLQLTQRFSSAFCQRIAEAPSGWFWIHRRWKTTPEGEREDFYKL